MTSRPVSPSKVLEHWPNVHCRVQKTYLIYFQLATRSVSGTDEVTADTSCPSSSLWSCWPLTSSHSTFYTPHSLRSRKKRLTKICSLVVWSWSLYSNYIVCCHFIQCLCYITKLCICVCIYMFFAYLYMFCIFIYVLHIYMLVLVLLAKFSLLVNADCDHIDGFRSRRFVQSVRLDKRRQWAGPSHQQTCGRLQQPSLLHGTSGPLVWEPSGRGSTAQEAQILLHEPLR